MLARKAGNFLASTNHKFNSFIKNDITQKNSNYFHPFIVCFKGFGEEWVKQTNVAVLSKHYRKVSSILSTNESTNCVSGFLATMRNIGFKSACKVTRK